MLRIPLDPLMAIGGHVVASLAPPKPCITSYVAAFADEDEFGAAARLA